MTEKLKEAGNRANLVDTLRSNAKLHRGDDQEPKFVDFTDFRAASTALDDVVEMEEEAIDE